MNAPYNTRKRTSYVSKKNAAYNSSAATSVESKMANLQHKTFAFVTSLTLSRWLLCRLRFLFVSTFNLQRGRAFVVGITNLIKYAVCVKAKAPADHVYQRRKLDEFKRGLSVAHASQPIERAEYLEYRNQMPGVCSGAVYFSMSLSFWITLYYASSQNMKATVGESGLTEKRVQKRMK